MKNIMMWIGHHNKAIMGFVSSGFIAWLGVHSGGVTQDEWLQILGVALAGGGLVFAIPNIKKPGANDSNKV